MHRFHAQSLTRQESIISKLKDDLNRINRIIESRQGSAAMDYYTKQRDELTASIQHEETKLVELKARQEQL